MSVGNITAGGTGKTPITIQIARGLLERGMKPVVLSRGYRSEGRGTRVVSDRSGVRLPAARAGDEPFLIASSVPGLPVVVDPARIRGGEAAVARFSPDVVLLDDGFQHRRLGRDLDLVLLDAVDPFGRYRLLPAGALREPFSGLARADIFVVTHAPPLEPIETLSHVLRHFNATAPILRASHVLERLVALGSAPGPGSLAGLPVHAFCGIGNPESFRATLLQAGARLTGFEPFRDHHRFSPSEVRGIAQRASSAGASLVVTTEKDAVRLDPIPAHPPFAAARIRMEIEEEAALLDRIASLGRRSPATLPGPST